MFKCRGLSKDLNLWLDVEVKIVICLKIWVGIRVRIKHRACGKD